VSIMFQNMFPAIDVSTVHPPHPTPCPSPICPTLMCTLASSPMPSLPLSQFHSGGAGAGVLVGLLRCRCTWPRAGACCS